MHSALSTIQTDHEREANSNEFRQRHPDREPGATAPAPAVPPTLDGHRAGNAAARDPACLRMAGLVLVREAYRLDALAVVGMPDLDLQDLLLAKLLPKIGSYLLLLRFGEALGLSRAEFDAVEPLAGCMALTNFFYWMLAYGSVPEKIAAVSASEDIFIQICARVGPALMRNYAMSPEQVAFFTSHEEIGEQVTPIDAHVLARYDTAEERQRITRAVRLSHEFELLFYETVMAAPRSQP